MVKQILSVIAFVFFIGAPNTSAQSLKQNTANSSKQDLKFLDDITLETAVVPTVTENTTKSYPAKSEAVFTYKKDAAIMEAATLSSVEKATSLQFKYSLLLDIEVELVKNFSMFNIIDQWYGTRYRLGGTTKSGIDCSALMQVFFTALYGVSLPRTAREQYNFSQKISRTEIKEGDLVFFNTRGGVSHVGMYLSNNKFVHASSSGGVTISSLYDSYYASRLIGVGRINDAQGGDSFLLSSNP